MKHRQAHKDLFAPAHYSRFRCIADRCRHSCCVDWEICIDEDTLAKYRPIDSIMATVTECEDGACFALAEDGRCPHLDDRGLCRIILSHGEDYLSEICRHHPRFFRDVGHNRVEVGLGLVCEEACRLILADDRPFSLSKIGEVSGDDDASDIPSDFDPLPSRDQILAMIETPGRRFDETRAALRTAYALPDDRTPDEWIDRFLSLEILDPAWETTLRAAKGEALHPLRADAASYEMYYPRLLTYFVYRHVSIADSPSNLRARLAFALLSTEMIRRLFEREAEQSPAALMELSRRYSAEIEYSEDNTDELIFLLEGRLSVNRACPIEGMLT